MNVYYRSYHLGYFSASVTHIYKDSYFLIKLKRFFAAPLARGAKTLIISCLYKRGC